MIFFSLFEDDFIKFFPSSPTFFFALLPRHYRVYMEYKRHRWWWCNVEVKVGYKICTKKKVSCVQRQWESTAADLENTKEGHECGPCETGRWGRGMEFHLVFWWPEWQLSAARKRHFLNNTGHECRTHENGRWRGAGLLGPYKTL